MAPAHGLRPCIVARLKPGWRLDPARRAFVSGGESLGIDSLPDDTRVEPRFPDLAARDPAQLTPDEAEMAGYVQFVFPQRTPVERHLERILGWDSIAEAYVAPTPSLP